MTAPTKRQTRSPRGEARTMLAFRADPDAIARVDAAAVRAGESRSECVRRLLAAGLDAEAGR